ncbi:gamma-butyrobetaine dioxygenase-like isoform X2 [Oscarella lobularis]
MKSNDRQIHDAILSLEKHGLILLRNCGTEGNFVLELANLMAAGPYPSVFGPAVAPVISMQSGHYSDFIYTANEILLHTDLPVYRNVPPVLVMHSIETADWGGESLALDGFLAAEQLRQADPSAFNLLCEIPIPFRGTGNEYVDFYLEAWHPIIRTGKLGQLVQLCFNNSRAPRIALKHKDRLGDWYKAFYRLAHQIQRESNPLTFKRLLTPGSAIVVDNHRVLHGRSQMRLDNGKRRVLNTIYFDWDGVRAKGRTLEKKLS